MSPPISISVSISPVRVGFSMMFSITMSEPGVMRAATMGKAAEDGSPGTSRACAFSSCWPSMVMWRPSGFCSTVICAPKPFSMRSVWSRVGVGSITVVLPGVLRPASSTADFTWAEATGSV